MKFYDKYFNFRRNSHGLSGFACLVLSCDVCNSEPDERLWQEIADEEKAVRETVKLEQINKWLPIQATRQAYKRLGKDPNRYRPSSEALRRRILRELPLYKVDTLVDLINLVSIRSGYSIGGFDADKIAGGSLVLGVGREGEIYQWNRAWRIEYCRSARLPGCSRWGRNSDE